MDDLRDPQIVVSTNWRRATLIVAFVVMATISAFQIVAVRRAAEREYVSYDTLCSLGATGDDWVSFLEIVTGRPPIVQLKVPDTIPADTAFKLMPDLRNLESLSLHYRSLSDEQLDIVRSLGLDSLRFRGDFPTDADVPRLSRFHDVRFVYVPSTNLSATAKTQLQTLLPSSKIDFD